MQCTSPSNCRSEFLEFLEIARWDVAMAAKVCAPFALCPRDALLSFLLSSTQVTLYLYDLSQGMAKALSKGFLGKQIDGIYHTGIVVYGYEYCTNVGLCVAYGVSFLSSSVTYGCLLLVAFQGFHSFLVVSFRSHNHHFRSPACTPVGIWSADIG